MQDRVNRFIVANSKISEEKLRELMFRTGELARDIGTVVVGQDAVRYGLINEVGGLAQALRKLEELVEQNRQNRQAHPATNGMAVMTPGAPAIAPQGTPPAAPPAGPPGGLVQ